MYDQSSENYEPEAFQNSNARCFSIENLQFLEDVFLKYSILDKITEETIIEISNEFIDKIVDFSFKLAKHRGSDTLETSDIKLAFETLSNIKLPLRISDNLRDPKKSEKNTNHMHRMNAIQNIKKE